ncbi:GNAT family N-acetyltransferase [Pseudomonas vancouverensis]|uniref:N-acetyltransferase n=1 Tax=Pseudomonas vancouverensis TaxID=95300 RepID=A0A1H2NQ60_PSEVA|nr:GNAT family N-acetyltransferase [Pseudomonas vancouverensis]KAB0491258.1 GNAT family N-acetyltransferase [Pseudomonas vancouverensis]TDB64291.1 N-acetyltransferase [Pseudomonas vancouverensis]SDV07540.1 ribosomal-protein-alanine N-acetyltransferase [Pseudomonas vancouverensis]
MTSFNIRELAPTDTQALLAFEVQNREWFEAHIDAREPAFYSLQGVAEHIGEYLSGFAVGAWHPLVIEDVQGNIVGRANLKNIDATSRCAEVGYRVGEQFCGQGLATLALRHLIETARSRWALTQLLAYVFEDNAGSQKVLERCGFVPDPVAIQQTGNERRFVLTL